MFHALTGGGLFVALEELWREILLDVILAAKFLAVLSPDM
jgi:hypothetical protein